MWIISELCIGRCTQLSELSASVIRLLAITVPCSAEGPAEHPPPPQIVLRFLLCALVDSVLEDGSKISNFDFVQNTTRQNAALEIIKSG
jgi:hypothetical protein